MIIFFYGEDTFRSAEKLSEIKKKFQNSDSSNSGLSLFDFSEKISARDALNSLQAQSLFSSKRLVIVKNLLAQGLAEEKEIFKNQLKEKIQKLEKDADLVLVFWEGSSPKKNDAIYKMLIASKGTKKQEFEKLSGFKLNQWIQEKIKNINLAVGIEPKALEKLISYAGNETMTLDKEIEKLASLADKRSITEQDVEDLVRANINSNIFSTVDALGQNNKKLAVKLLQDHLEKGDDPFYLLSMFVYQFRNLLKIAELASQHYPEVEIARLTKINPYVIRKSLSQARNFSFSRLKNIYQELSEIDQKSKTGKIDIRLALGKFVAEM